VAKIYIDAEKIDVTHHFLVRAVLNRTWKNAADADYQDQPFWTLTWWNPADSEYLLLIVPAGGKVERLRTGLPKEPFLLKAAPELSLDDALNKFERYSEDQGIAGPEHDLMIAEAVPPTRDHMLYWRFKVRRPDADPLEIRVMTDGTVWQF